MKNTKESLNITKQNQMRLTILSVQLQKYMEFLKELRLKKQNHNQEKKFQLNPDFLKNKQKEEVEIESKLNNEERPLFIFKKIENIKEKKEDIDEKIDDFQKEKNPKNKEELFLYLEKEINEFSAIVESLKIQNRKLKKELELLLEREAKENEKKSLEKENEHLKNKIEKIRDKEPLKAEKINKVSYRNNEKEALYE
jgi:hypothetical protein